MEEESKQPKDDKANVSADNMPGGQKSGGDINTDGGDNVVGSKIVNVNHQQNYFPNEKESIYNKKFKEASPYKGLEKFDIDDEEEFCGRESNVDSIYEILDKHYILIVTGASGSGKSSLIRAGLIPRLKDSKDDIIYLIFQPSDNPFEQLELCLKQKIQNYNSGAELDKNNLKDSLFKVFKSLNNKFGDNKWLIFIDQFEEIFTSTTDKLIRDNFINSIVHLIKNKNNLPVYIVLTIRSDFLEKLGNYADFIKIYNDRKCQYMLGSMTKQELREAIEKPAKSHGVVFEENLVDLVIEDYFQENKKELLPLLQYTLKYLWKEEKYKQNITQENRPDKRQLTRNTYEKIGRVKNALKRRLKCISEKFKEEENESALKEILLELIQTEDNHYVSRSIEKNKILGNDNKSKIKEKIFNLLVEERFLVVNENKVELVHEQLIETWDIIQKLIKEKKHIIDLRKQLISAAQYWHNSSNELATNKQKRDDLLWYDSRFTQYENNEKDLNFNDSENKLVTQFIEESRQRYNHELEKTIEDKKKLQIALNESQMREQSARVWKLLSTNQTFYALALAVKTMGDNLKRLPEEDLRNENLAKHPGKILGVVQESLNQVMTQGRVANMCEGHEDSVFSVAFSPDGKMIVSGSSDGQIHLWDINGNPIAKTLCEHTDSIFSVAFSPDGKMIVSGSYNRKICLWKFDNEGKLSCVQTLARHKNFVNSVAFSPDGKMIVSGSGDKTICLWKFDNEGNFKLDKTLQGHTDSVNSVAFSPDGKMIVSGSADETICLWDTKGNPIGEPLQEHNNGVESVAFSPDGKMIVSGSADKTIRLWKIDNEGNFKLDKTLQGHNQSVNSVAFSPKTTIIISGSADKKIRFWDIEGNIIDQPLQGHEESILSVAFSPDGETIASGSEDSKLCLWDIKGNSIGQPLRGHEGKVYSAAFSPNGEIIASGGEDKTIRLWKIGDESNIKLYKTLERHEAPVKSVAFNPNGEILASCGDESKICLWNIDKGEFITQLLDDENTRYKVRSVVFSPDGKILASGCDDNKVRLWQKDNEGNFSLDKILEKHKNWVNSVAFSPDGKILASGSRDSTVCLWDIETKSLIHNQIWCGDKVYINYITFSPDGENIACGCSDNKISLRNAKKGTAITEDWLGHEGEVNCIAFSPDGQMVVSCSHEHILRLWDTEANPFIPPWSGHQDEVNCVAFSPDGKMIISGSHDGTLRLWRGGWKAWFKVCSDRLAPLILKEPKKFIHEDLRCEACAKFYKYNQPWWTWKITDTEFGNILIEQGKQFAEWGFGKKSYDKFKKAIEYDPKLEEKIIKVAKEELNKLVEKLFSNLPPTEKEKWIEFHKKFQESQQELQKLNRSIIITAEKWSDICWYGSLNGFAKEPNVRQACETAVKLNPEDVGLRDTRGVNRALNHEFEEAIEDFQAFINTKDDDDAERSFRVRWVSILKTKQNPFTEDEINKIIQHYNQKK